MPRLSERFARQHRFSPPPSFRKASTYPGIDRPASGIAPMTPREHTTLLARRLRACCFRSGFVPTYLTSPLVRTPWPVIRNGRYDTGPQRSLLQPFHAISACSCLVSGSLHLPSRVLFNFQSPYYCAIGLGTYLGLGVCASHIHTRFPTHATLDTPNLLPSAPLRDFHPLWCSVPGDFELGR